MLAHELITDASAFTVGTLARDRRGLPCGTLPESGAVKFDCLGALLVAHQNAEKRAPVAKRVFDLCVARFDHKRLGRLDHAEAVELLKGAWA